MTIEWIVNIKRVYIFYVSGKKSLPSES